MEEMNLTEQIIQKGSFFFVTAMLAVAGVSIIAFFPDDTYWGKVINTFFGYILFFIATYVAAKLIFTFGRHVNV